MPKSRAPPACTIPAHVTQQEKWAQLPGPASPPSKHALQPCEHTEVCPSPHWACSGSCSVCLPSPCPTSQLTRGPLYSASLSGRLLQSSGFLPAGQKACAKIYSYSLQGYR